MLKNNSGAKLLQLGMTKMLYSFVFVSIFRPHLLVIGAEFLVLPEVEIKSKRVLAGID